MGSAPERCTWAVELLAPRPRDRVLEIGCGNGVAAQLLLDEYPKLRLSAIDRSAAAIAASKKKLAPFIEEGRASVVRSELVEFSPQGRFNRAFAINVNSFWLDATADLEALSPLLSPAGAFVLVFEPPSAKQIARIAEACSERLRVHGFARVTVMERESLLAIRAFRER